MNLEFQRLRKAKRRFPIFDVNHPKINHEVILIKQATHVFDFMNKNEKLTFSSLAASCVWNFSILNFYKFANFLNCLEETFKRNSYNVSFQQIKNMICVNQSPLIYYLTWLYN